MPRGGRALVGFQAIDVGGQPLPNFFRFVASNCDTVSREHIDEMLADIAAIGAAFELPATRDSPSASRDHTRTPHSTAHVRTSGRRGANRWPVKGGARCA